MGLNEMFRETTRRSFIKMAVAGIGVATIGSAASAATKRATAGDWESEKSSIDGDIYDVAHTSQGAYAVATAGIVIERTKNGWQKVIDGGPSGNGNDLYCADVTDDGKRLWFAGASGAIGEYDVETGNLVDKSAPNDNTNNFNGIAVMGKSGEANVYVADNSGKISYSFDNGKSQTWNSVTPGGGSGLPAIDFHASKSGHVIDANANVYSTDDGSTWNRIGISGADVSFYGVDSDASDDVHVSGGGGTVFEYDGSKWMSENIAQETFKDIEIEGDSGYAVGNSGTVMLLENGKWSEETTPTSENLNAVARGNTSIAVGAAGTVIAKDESGGGGNNPPSCSIVNPSAGATVTGTIMIEVSVSDSEDDNTNLDVEVSIDGGAWQKASYNTGSSSYEYDWDTTSMSNADHTLQARATDSMGATTKSSQITVTVDNSGDESKSVPEAIAGEDDKISFSELQDAIGYWANDEEVPNTGGKKIDFDTLQSLIRIWATDGTV